MCRRYMPLEEWEWIAISGHRELFDPTMLLVATTLYRTECMAHHDSFARRNINEATHGTDNGAKLCNTARIEHRLYTLFAE